MFFQDDSSNSSLSRGPQRLIDSLMNQNQSVQFKNKHLLGQKSKFRIALEKLQEDYRPSDSVSCRDQEKKIIQNYIREGLTTQGCSESLYISGVPGIGKTLCVQEVVRKLEQQFKDSMKAIYTNALSLAYPIDIFRTIYYSLTDTLSPSNTAMYLLNQYFQKGIDNRQPVNRYQEQFFSRMAHPTQSKQKYLKMKKVIIIDEVDYLRTKNEEVLYNIFDWTQKKKSKLIIIAISNTTNLPELLSPRVNSRMGNRRLVFSQYESCQIQQILKERISSLDVFDQQAITFTCRKIAQCSSDIRKSLNVLRESINEFILQEKALKKNLRDEDLKNKKISVDVLTKVMDRIMRDLFVTSFHDFPSCYKIVLYFLAKHFRSQSGPCTMRKLEYLSSSFTKSYNQLLSTLTDLKELGLIKIQYSTVRKQAKFFGFVNMKQLKEQHITLEVGYQKIIYALQKEDLNELSRGNFRLDLNL